MTILNVLVTMPFGNHLLDKIRAVSPQLNVQQATPDEADYSSADILYCFMPPRDLSRAPNLKWVQLHLAGVNMLYDHPIYQSRIPLATTSGVHAASAAEYTFTVLLALAHRVPRMIEWHSQSAWPPDEQRWPLFVPSEVRGQTIGIIAYGSIGREVARIAKTFAMKVIVTKRDLTRKADDGYRLPGTGDPNGALPEAWFAPAQLNELLAQSDYVVMCAPLTRETEQMLGANEIRSMKPSAYFINVGRGATVDEEALARALAEQRIAGAALDVFSQEPPPDGSPFYKLDNVILSPHVSGFIPSYDDKCTDLFVENLQRYLSGQPLLNLVDRSKGY
jgi:phosphoglycerate dehydrogenase-like enzyme